MRNKLKKGMIALGLVVVFTLATPKPASAMTWNEFKEKVSNLWDKIKGPGIWA